MHCMDKLSTYLKPRRIHRCVVNGIAMHTRSKINEKTPAGVIVAQQAVQDSVA